MNPSINRVSSFIVLVPVESHDQLNLTRCMEIYLRLTLFPRRCSLPSRQVSVRVGGVLSIMCGQ